METATTEGVDICVARGSKPVDEAIIAEHNTRHFLQVLVTHFVGHILHVLNETRYNVTLLRFLAFWVLQVHTCR